MSNIEQLKKESILVQDGMVTYYPQYKKEEILYVSDIAAKFNGRYAANNSTLAYVMGYNVYVTPYTREAVHILVSEGFKRACFFVPFSNWDYPKDKWSTWYMLRAKAQEAHHVEFIADCIDFSDRHFILELPEEVIGNCLQIPMNGIAVKHPNYETTIYPAIRSDCLDCIAIEQIGKFCKNNGRVTFVYRDGSTYVTKGYRIVADLQKAGYTEAPLFVPLSNGETIIDPVLRERWDAIHK